MSEHGFVYRISPSSVPINIRSTTLTPRRWCACSFFKLGNFTDTNRMYAHTRQSQVIMQHLPPSQPQLSSNSFTPAHHPPLTLAPVVTAAATLVVRLPTVCRQRLQRTDKLTHQLKHTMYRTLTDAAALAAGRSHTVAERFPTSP